MGIKPEQWDNESLAIAMDNANKSDRTMLREKDPVETPDAVKSKKATKKRGRPQGSKNRKKVKAKIAKAGRA